MFEMSFVEGRARTRRAWTAAVSFLLQVALVLAALLIPLLRPELLPASLAGRVQLLAPPGPPPAPPAPAAASAGPVRRAARQSFAGRLVMPQRMPARAAVITDEPGEFLAPASGHFVPGGVPGGGSGVGPWFGPAPAPPPPPPPPEPPPAAPVKRIGMGGTAIEGKLPRPAAAPVYPPLARQTRTQGVVVLAALIDTGGRVRNLRVLSGHPLLTGAALEAVRQWRYIPTLLNGVPVEVETTIEVKFLLR